MEMNFSPNFKNKPFQLKISFRQKITLILCGLFLFFVLLEVSLRLGGFILLSMQEYRNTQSIKQKGTYRILCLGESTTQGQYPQFLEEALNQRNIGVRFSVIDEGRRGMNTPAILSRVEFYLDEYHPDMVVAMMGINDKGEHIPYEVATTSKVMLFVKSFQTYKFSRLLWLHLLVKAKEVGFYKTKKDRRGFEGVGLKKYYAEPILMEESFKKVTDLNLKNDNDYVKLGMLCQEQGKFPQAEAAFKKAMELNPKNDNVYVELGWFYREQNKPLPAEGLLKKAIEINPKNDQAYIGLGGIYRKQGKLPQAEGLLKKAIEINPKNDQAYISLGGLYQEQSKLFQAEDLFKRAIEINPEYDNMYGAMSALCEEMGSRKLAKEYAWKANMARLEYYIPVTVNNYRKLKVILGKRGIRLVCVQYPMRNIEPLKKIFGDNARGVIFTDNEKPFKDVVKQGGARRYFRDMFGGDFGHCTDKGNRLLAQNIADVIFSEVFNKQ